MNWMRNSLSGLNHNHSLVIHDIEYFLGGLKLNLNGGKTIVTNKLGLSVKPSVFAVEVSNPHWFPFSP